MSALIVSTNEKDLSKFAAAMQQLAQGRSNAVGSFTLTANAASTTVTAPNCGSGSVPIYIPTTANASAEIGAGTIYVGTVNNGSFVVTHANNAQNDRTYKYFTVG